MLLLRFLPLLMILTGSQVYGVTKYEIKVTTSDDIYAGTDASVQVNLIGVNGASTGSINLHNSVQDFRRGRTDTFYRDASPVGHLKAIKVHHDGSGFLPAWKITRITVRFNRSPLYTFYFNRWIPARRWVTANEQNECRAGLALCQHLCIDTGPGYNCACRTGFKLEGRYKCRDVNECIAGNHKCEEKSTNCKNNFGSYGCKCKDEYEPGLSPYKCNAKRCNISIPLGMENGHISNQSITASSHYRTYPPWHARLNSGTAVSWYALPSDPNPWIQVDLDLPTWLKGVATQGKRFSLFVKTYKLAYSSDGIHWSTYKEANEEREMIFKGNTEPYKMVKVELENPIYTRYVRLYPKTWRHGIAVKMELYGCQPE